MQLLQEAGLPDGVINLVYGSGRDDRRRRAREPGPRRHPLHRLDRRLPRRCGRRSATNIARYRNYPRIVGETGGKDFIVAHPSADVDAVATRDRPRRVRVPGPEVLGRLARVRRRRTSGRSVRERLARRGRADQDGRRRRLRELHGRRHRRELVRRRSRRRSTRPERDEQTRGRSSAAASATSDGCFVEPTVIETRRPGLPADARRALRAGGDRLRLPRRASGARRSTSSTRTRRTA